MAKQKESALSRKIIVYLESLGFKAWKNAGSQFQEAGRPDVMAIRMAVVGGHRTCDFLAIEVKLPGQEPTALQQRWMDDADTHGAIAFCAHSLDEVKQELKRSGLA